MESGRRFSINLDSCIPGKCSSVQHGNELVALASSRYKEDHIAAYMKWLCYNCGRVCDSLGRTALHVASSCGHCLIAYWLVRNMAANVNFKDAESGYTSLHRAILYGQIHVAVTLLKLGANAAIKDHEGMTPFDLLVRDQRYLTLQFSIDYGNNDVYVWGSNTNFNLGTGKQQSRSHPESLESFRKQHIKIKQVCMERFHTVFVCNDGKVYSCGHGQGGRLGLGTEQAALIPTQVHFQLHKHQSKESDAKIKCIKASVGQDHSMFVTEGGLVWVCGMNNRYQLGLSPPPSYVLSPKSLPPQSLKSVGNDDLGICAAQYHSVIWGKNALLTFGTNAGQLGHRRSSDPAIITPREVVSLRGKGEIIKVTASNGAIAVALHRDTFIPETVIYLLHEFECRRIATRRAAVRQLHVLGGNLDETIITKDEKQNTVKREMNHLRLFMLDQRGNLHYWEDEVVTEISRCTYALGRAIAITSFTANLNGGLLLSTDEYEAFEGDVKVHASLPKSIKMKLKRIPSTYRAVDVCCDPNGRNFAILQTSPSAFVEAVQKVSKSEMTHEMKTFLEETSEDDFHHDVIFQVGNMRFPAHKFVTASKSDYIKRQIEAHGNDVSNVLELKLSNIHPIVFRELLCFIYSSDCVFIKKGKFSERLIAALYNDVEPLDNRMSQSPEKKGVVHGQQKHSTKMKKNPLQIAIEAASQLEIPSFLSEAEKFRYENGHIVRNLKGDMPEKLPIFRRSELPELYDLRICGMDGVELQAHKCILCARCQYFQSMLCGSWAEASGARNIEKAIQLPISSAVLEALLDFLYEDDSEKVMTSTDSEFVANILTLADQICLNRLKGIAEFALANLVTLHNVGRLLQLSEIYGAKKLKFFCMEFITYNMAAVLEIRSLVVVSYSLLQELSTHYISNNRAMSYRVITPSSTAPAEDLVDAVGEALPVSLSLIDELENNWEYGLLPKKGTVTSKRKSNRKLGTDKNINKKALNDALDVNECEQEAVSSTAVETSATSELDVHQHGLSHHISSSDSDSHFIPKALSEQQQNILEARLKLASAARAGDIEATPVGFINLTTQLKEHQNIYDTTASACINIEDLHLFPELKSPSPSPPMYARHLPMSSPPLHSRQQRHIKLSQKQRKKLAIADDCEGSGAAAETGEEQAVPSAWGVLPMVEHVHKEVTSPINIPTGFKHYRRTQPSVVPLDGRDRSSDPEPSAISRMNHSASFSPSTSSNAWMRESEVTGVEKIEPEIAFSEIVAHQRRQRESLSKMRDKPLEVTQLEEKAMKEMHAFYNADEAADERITVRRVHKEDIPKPDWSIFQLRFYKRMN